MAEGKDYIDVREAPVGIEALKAQFTKKLKEHEAKFTAKFKPFCRPAARDHFDRLVAMHQRDYQIDKQFRGEGKITAINLDEFPWERFGNEENFIKLETKESYSNHPMNPNLKILTEVHEVFMWSPVNSSGDRGNERGYKIDVFTPIQVWNDMRGIETQLDDHGMPKPTPINLSEPKEKSSGKTK